MQKRNNNSHGSRSALIGEYPWHVNFVAWYISGVWWLVLMETREWRHCYKDDGDGPWVVPGKQLQDWVLDVFSRLKATIPCGISHWKNFLCKIFPWLITNPKNMGSFWMLANTDFSLVFCPHEAFSLHSSIFISTPTVCGSTRYLLGR